jgi:hypothetical protein
MATPVLTTQALTSLENAKKYLQDQGNPADNHMWLALHVNAASAWIQSYSGRKNLVYTGVDKTEYYSGDGTSELFLNELPVRQITQVILAPFDDAGVSTTYAGPTSPAFENTDMYYISDEGLLVAKTFAFPPGRRSVQVDYQPGLYVVGDVEPDTTVVTAPDPERTMLEMIVLEAISMRWRKWKDQSAGVKSRHGEGGITYKEEDFDQSTLDWLKLLRRQMWV